jgi:hypothetical protein
MIMIIIIIIIILEIIHIQTPHSSTDLHVYLLPTLFVTQDMQHACNVTFRRVRLTIFAVEKQQVITYSKHVSVALVIQHANRMRRIILSSVACLALPYLST